MKRILLAACLLMTVACNSKTSTAMQTTTESVFGLGVPVSDNFTGEAWLRTLSAEPGYDCQIYNRHFRPSTRNYWPIGMPWDKSCSAPKESDFIRNKALRHAV
ncbi:MAG: hypothetical protein ACLR8Y_20870 [Alistipes indistinctus]